MIESNRPTKKALLMESSDKTGGGLFAGVDLGLDLTVFGEAAFLDLRKDHIAVEAEFKAALI